MFFTLKKIIVYKNKIHYCYITGEKDILNKRIP